MTDTNLPPELPKKKRGCLFYGCLTLAILVIIGAIGLWLALHFVVKKAAGLVDQYTSTNPVPIESVTIAQPELKSLQDRVASFAEALDGRKGARELILSADDLNALIQKDPQYAGLKNKVFIMIEDDQIKGKVSMPLDDFGPVKLKGHYLNGIATFNVALKDGALTVKVKEVQVGGNSLPKPILSELNKADFSQNFKNDPDARKTIEKLESIQVKDGKLILRAKEQK